MTFFHENDLETLRIDQSVFHIVGPRPEHFQLLEAFDAKPHERFFLNRIRSVNVGNQYSFLDDAPVRTQLHRISLDPLAFQEESEKLAIAFDEAHGGATSVGAFLLFSLSSVSGQAFALLKFEDEKVLSYEFKEGRSGRPIPTFGEIERTFVQNRNALQKSALIQIGEKEDRLCVIDRQNNIRPAAYFERFLHVRRMWTPEQLTQNIVQAAKKVILKHKSILPVDTVRGLSQRLFDATQSGGFVDGEREGDWLMNIVGPLPESSPVLKDFQAELKQRRISGESFDLQKNAIPKPRNRRIETASSVRITFPAELPKSIVSVNEGTGEIIIRDKIILNDVDIEATR